MSAKKFFRRRRLWLIPIAIMVVSILVLLIVGEFTPVLTAWILKPLIDSTTFTAPPNFEIIEESVVVKRDIVYDEQGTLLDIYSPRQAKAPLPVILWIHEGGFIGASKEKTKVYALTLA